MTLKQKALVFNFLCFAVIFILVRFLLGHYVEDINRVILSIAAAITASVLAPKFTVVRIENVERLVMKWILKKGVKEL